MPKRCLHIELDTETDGRIIAEVLELPGVMAYGQDEQQAIDAVKALALQVLADQYEHGESAITGFDFVPTA